MSKIRNLIIGILFLVINSNAYSQQDSSNFEIFDLTLEELMNLEVQTATKYPSKLQDVSASSMVITSDDINIYGWRNLADVLKAQVGFDVFSDRIYNFVVNRGFYISNDPNSRILLLVNGHSVIEFFGYYNGQLANIDINHVKRIEIVKGPSSSTYGTNAMFAVINVITKKGKDIEGIDVINEIGSHGHEKYTLAAGRKFNNGIDVMAQGTLLNNGEQILYFDEYDNPAYNSGGYSKRSCNRMDLKNFSVLASYKNFRINSLYSNRKKHVPTGLYGGRFNDDKTFFQDINHFFELAYDYELNDFLNGTIKIYNDNYEFKGRYAFYPDSNWQTGPDYEYEHNSIKNTTYGGEILVNTNFHEKHNTLLSFEYKDFYALDFEYTYESNNLVSSIEEFSMNPNVDLFSTSLLHEYDLMKNIKLMGGIRYDYYNKIADNLSFRGGIHYHPKSKLRIKLLYGEAFRAPNLWEINGGFYIEGNQGLDPETIQNAEFIFDIDFSSKIKSTTSIFWYKTQNSIQPDTTFLNVKGIYGRGFETSLKYVASYLNSYINFTFCDVRKSTNDKRITFTPKYMVKAGLMKEVIKDKIAIGFENQYIGKRYRALKSQGMLPAYNLANITLSSAKVFKNIDISCSVYNILNVSYEHPSFLGDLASYNMNQFYPVYDIPANKRNFIFKVKYHVF